jgi:hypothetical protein
MKGFSISQVTNTIKALTNTVVLRRNTLWEWTIKSCTETICHFGPLTRGSVHMLPMSWVINPHLVPTHRTFFPRHQKGGLSSYWSTHSWGTSIPNSTRPSSEEDWWPCVFHQGLSFQEPALDVAPDSRVAEASSKPGGLHPTGNICHPHKNTLHC